MNLLYKSNNVSGIESEMQEAIAEYFSEKNYKVYREIRIPDIGRISDVIVQVTPKKIFNIECKISNYTSVLKQAKDHLRWADYSYICMSPKAFIPPFDISIMVKKGIGLLYWNKKIGIIEAFGCYKNTGIDKRIRENVMKTLSKKDIQQQKLF